MKTPKLHPFPNWLPNEIQQYYKEVGINGLFQWQHDIITKSAGLEKNIVFSAPTSAGKSIVAEILAFKVAKSGKKVLLTLPYISIAREKLYQLQRCWRRADITVSGFIGPHSVNPSEWMAAVCTIEKAASLVNRALTEDWFEEIGLIIVDELHMLFDSSRGPTIEYLLAKCIFSNRLKNTKIRIVGMSATIPQLQQVATWLDADMFEANFRPIQLDEKFVEGEKVFQMASEGKGDLCAELQTNIDPVLSVSEEAYRNGKQTLVFCSSKMETEKISIELAKLMDPLFRTKLKDLMEKKKAGLIGMKEKLEKLGCDDKMMFLSLARGIAFHHAGLTVEERECVEDGFRDGHVMVVVATSTLASGVNLPAERVVIKAQTRGPSALTQVSYRQMVGRAGRLGYCNVGESFLVAKKTDQEKILELVLERNPTQKQRFMDVPRFLLETISTGLVTTESDMSSLCGCLLDPPTMDTLTPAVQKLEQNSFICKVVAEDDDNSGVHQLRPTQLARATLASSLPPDAALFIFDDLTTAAKSVALDTELHLLYLVTPVNVSVWHQCDWNHLFALFSKLNEPEKRVAKLVGASERFLMEKLQGRQANEKKLQIHIRFFSALALHELINEGSLLDVSTKFRITRGCLQTLQNQSATYASMVVAFCSRLGWLYLKSLLDGFALRLQFGIRSELSELVTVDGIDGHRARALHEKGLTCVSQIVSTDLKRLATCLQYAVPYSRNGANDGKAEWLVGQRSSLEEAAKELKERAKKMFLGRIRELGLNIDLNEVKMTFETEPKIETKLDVEACSRSILEMTIEEEDDDIFKVKPAKEAEEPMVDSLETTLMMVSPPKKKDFYLQLSQKYHLKNVEDSFECSLIVVKKDKRSSLIAKRKSIGLDTSVASSCNSSFDVFASPSVRKTMKHKRIPHIPCSPSALAIASPIQKHQKTERWVFEVKDVCRTLTIFNIWLAKAKEASEASIAPLYNAGAIIGVAVSVPESSVYLPISTENLPCQSGLDRILLPDKNIHKEKILSAIADIADKRKVFVRRMDDVFHLYQQLGIRIDDVVVVEMLVADDGAADTPFQAMKEAFSNKEVSETAMISSTRASSSRSVELELATANAVADIFYNGLPFDAIKCAKGIAQLRRKLNVLEDEAWKLAGQKFNFDSSQQVAAILFTKLRLVHPGGANKKHLQTNKTVLEKMKEQHPIVEKILLYRHINHTLTQCLLPLSTHETREDGRMRCFFNLCTATGRMLAHRPNLQNVPKNESLDGFCVRQVFRAEPGNVLIGADYSQLELRVLAHLSNDKYLLLLLSDERDIFADLSAQWNFSRANVKQLCYGLIYGMGVKSLAELTQLDQTSAEQLWKSFFKTFPQVQTYINETKEKAFRMGFVETLLGRKHPTSRSAVLEEKAREERIVVNYTIQGTASEIFKNALVEIRKAIRGHKSKLIMTIHDEVLLEVAAEEADTVAELVKKCMINSLAELLRVPLRVSLKIEKSWDLLK